MANARPLCRRRPGQPPALASLLLERGADPDTPRALYHAAFHRDHACLRLLLEHGARAEGPSALGAAISIADTEAVRILLNAGIDPRLPIPADALGEAADHTATIAALQAAIQWRGDADMVDLLLAHGAEPASGTEHTPSTFRLAARTGDRRLLDVLRRHGVPDDGTTTEALLGACARGDRAAATELIRAEPDLVSRLGEEHHAVIVDAAEHLGPAPVSLMLDLGFPVNTRRKTDGATALHAAAYAGRADVVRLLIGAGADIEAHDHTFGSTPLPWATVGSAGESSATSNWVDVVTALLDAGASPDGAWVAAKPPSDEVANLLIAYGIDPPEE